MFKIQQPIEITLDCCRLMR